MKETGHCIILSLFLLTGVISCSSTSNDPEEEELQLAEFEGVVGTSPNTGLYEQLGGLAQFELVDSDTTFSFVFLSNVVSDTATTKIVFSMKSSEIPSEGVYNFNNIDTTSQIFSSGFSGFYLSPTIGFNEQYYTESGKLTIISSESAKGIKGSFKAVIFSKAITGPDSYTRQYSKLEGEFFAAPKNLR